LGKKDAHDGPKRGSWMEKKVGLTGERLEEANERGE